MKVTVAGGAGLTGRFPLCQGDQMYALRRHVSILLALLLVLSSASNAAFVICTSGTDHHAVEPVGHQAASSECVSQDSVTLDSHAHDANEHHPHHCADIGLAGFSGLQRGAAEPALQDLPPLLLAILPDSEIRPAMVDARSAWLSVPPPREPLPRFPQSIRTVRLLI